ncbi:Uncharacterised protein [Klebsiella oxytoca]|nr:Uncharacterised protein [Klebsiella oxytoca]
MSDTLQILFKKIFIFDLNHESLEVNIMGNNSLLFIKTIRGKYSEVSKALYEIAVMGKDNSSGLNHKVQNRDKLKRITTFVEGNFIK